MCHTRTSINNNDETKVVKCGETKVVKCDEIKGPEEVPKEEVPKVVNNKRHADKNSSDRIDTVCRAMAETKEVCRVLTEQAVAMCRTKADKKRKENYLKKCKSRERK
jgi:hypothetical protein